MTEIAGVPTFPLTSLADTHRFEAQLDRYVKTRCKGHGFSHFSLSNVFTELQARSDGSKLFAALVDIRLNMALLYIDSITIARLFNRTMPRGVEVHGPFNEATAFDLRMDMHAHANAFAFRFRSVWDKVMGVLVLVFEPAQYENFANGARSKKAAFRKIMTTNEYVNGEFVSSVERLIQRFDDSIRTPEAHGTGRLRKSSFTWVDPAESAASWTTEYHNFSIEVSSLIGGLFDPDVRRRRSAPVDNDRNTSD
jgi:hypothetical protein